MANPFIFDDPTFFVDFGYFHKSSFALYSNISLGVAPSDIYDYKNGEWVYYNSIVASSLVSTNIPYLPGVINGLNFPSRAYLALGSSSFRFVTGRDRLSWGNGILGNIALGDTLPYHKYLSLTYTGSRWFNYQCLVDLYSPFNAIEKGMRAGDVDGVEGSRFMLGHRFEFSLLKNRFTLAFSDLITYYSSTSFLDPSILNPVIYLHNLYIPSFSNSLNTLELTYTPRSGITLYA